MKKTSEFDLTRQELVESGMFVFVTDDGKTKQLEHKDLGPIAMGQVHQEWNPLFSDRGPDTLAEQWRGKEVTAVLVKAPMRLAIAMKFMPAWFSKILPAWVIEVNRSMSPIDVMARWPEIWEVIKDEVNHETT